MIITQLESENIKKLKAIRIKPDGSPLVTIGGKNGQGKTCALDSIQYAIGGKASIPDKPIREGEEKARVKLDLGDYIVERKFSPSGSVVTVKNHEGATFSSPQKMLDSMYGDLSFDPLEFSRMSPKQQAEILRGFSPFDFEKNESLEKAASEARTIVNREIKTLKGQLEGLPFHDDAPDEEVNPTELYREIEKAKAHNKGLSDLHGLSHDQTKYGITLQERIDRNKDAIKQLQAEIEKWQGELEKSKATIKNAEAEIQAFKLIDIAPLEEKLEQAHGLNQKLADNKRHAEIAEQLQERSKASDKLTLDIEMLREERQLAVKDAKLPIDGLSFDSSGISINGIPFEQCSSAEQLRTSVAVGLALNPKLKVLLIREGSLLDEDNLKLVAEMAEAAGAQVWAEKVGKEGVGIIIEDGEIQDDQAGA